MGQSPPAASPTSGPPHSSPASGRATLALASSAIARAIAGLQRSQHLARLAGQRLLVCIAVDACRTSRSSILTYPQLLQYLCTLPNLTETKNLPGVLFLWRGCHLTLESKISEEHGLIRGCPGILRTALLREDEPEFDNNAELLPHVLAFLPRGLIIHIPDRHFQQSALLSVGDCLLEPVTWDFAHRCTPAALAQFPADIGEALASAPLTVTRRQFPCTNALAATVYSLQGQTLEAMIADFARPPGMGRVRPSVADARRLYCIVCFLFFDFCIRMSIGCQYLRFAQPASYF